MTHGPYAKGLAFRQGYAPMWDNLVREHPDAIAGSTNRYLNWETVDPEKWVPDGYAVIRVDSRGGGNSPGYLDIFSSQETRDYYECIEWAGVQPWSNGKVGLLGISYYGVNQWQVAALRPPHLAAICPWEGASDYYREFTHHGGILNIFVRQWYPVQVSSVQYGLGPDGPRNAETGALIAGPERLSDGELLANRAPTVRELRDHPLLDDYYTQRTADLSQIEIPVLSATNWGHHLHTRGGFEGYLGVSSKQKWLEVHGLQHWVEFFTDYGVRLQTRFFGHFLKGEDTGWDRQPPVALKVRRVDGTFADRSAAAWPLPETRWTELYLDAEHRKLTPSQPAHGQQASFEAMGEGLTYYAKPTRGAVTPTAPGTRSASASPSSRACRSTSTSKSGHSQCSSPRATGWECRSSAATSSSPATAPGPPPTASLCAATASSCTPTRTTAAGRGSAAPQHCITADPAAAFCCPSSSRPPSERVPALNGSP
jgi:putative CocE/NonD family hydrolase